MHLTEGRESSTICCGASGAVSVNDLWRRLCRRIDDSAHCESVGLSVGTCRWTFHRSWIHTPKLPPQPPHFPLGIGILCDLGVPETIRRPGVCCRTPLPLIWGDVHQFGVWKWCPCAGKDKEPFPCFLWITIRGPATLCPLHFSAGTTVGEYLMIRSLHCIHSPIPIPSPGAWVTFFTSAMVESTLETPRSCKGAL